MFPVVFFGLSVLGALLHIIIGKTPVVETFLMYFLVVSVGFQGIYCFVGHYFLSDQVAESIGWPAGNPFQKEIGFTNLAFGILGVLCIWFRGGFWLATAIGVSVFLLGASVVHFQDIHKNRNLHPGNAGFVLVADIVIPVVILVLAAVSQG